MYLGGHEQYGEDGLMVLADRAIGRDDYGQPQCSFRKRINSNTGGCEPLSLLPGWREPRGPQITQPWWRQIFTRRRTNRRQSRKSRQGSRFMKRIGQLIRQGRDVTFTNDIALIKLRNSIQFSDRIHPVKLPPNDFTYMGYQCYVSGWGIQGPNEGPSPTLKGAELAVRIYSFRILLRFYILY